MMRIGEFLKRNKTAVSIEDDKTYKRPTIKVRNGGVFLRDVEKWLQYWYEESILNIKRTVLAIKDRCS